MSSLLILQDCNTRLFNHTTRLQYVARLQYNTAQLKLQCVARLQYSFCKTVILDCNRRGMARGPLEGLGDFLIPSGATARDGDHVGPPLGVGFPCMPLFLLELFLLSLLWNLVMHKNCWFI